MVGNIIYTLLFGASNKSKNEVEQDLQSHQKFDETQNEGVEGVNKVPTDDFENSSLDVQSLNQWSNERTEGLIPEETLMQNDIQLDDNNAVHMHVLYCIG